MTCSGLSLNYFIIMESDKKINAPSICLLSIFLHFTASS